MYRILFPVILLLCGNNLLGQTILADNLLQKIIDDPDNQFDHLRALEKEYSAFNEAALIPHLKKAEKVILDHLDPRSQIDAFRSLGALCWSKNFSAEALSFYDRSIEISLSIEEFLEAGIGYWQLAGHFSEREKYPQALERVYKANEYFILSGDMMWQAKARSMAASIGYRAHNYILSVEEIEKSLLLFRSLEPSQFNHADSIEFMSTLNTCGLSYAGLRNEEKAIACYAEAEKVAVLLNNKFWIGLINGNKGHVFAARGDIDRAIRSLEIDLRSSLAFKQYRSAMSSSISLSDLCIRKNQWTAAKRYLDTARQLMKTVKASRASQERYLKNLSKVLAYEGKDEQAYATLLRHDEIHDSLEAEQQDVGLARVKTSFDIQQKQSEIELLTTENELKEQQVAYTNTVVEAAALIILLLFILAFVINRNYKRKKKDNHLLIERNNEIKAINEELRAYADTLSSQNDTIQKMNEDLEIRVVKRTHELQEANTELDMFLYRASHDIRRPITTLLGLGNLANVTTQDVNAVQLFSKVTETASHMDRMLHKLQMIYALNRPPGISTQIQITQAIQNAIDRFSEEMKKIRMDCTLSVKESVSLAGDESLYSIIFQNLIENAITFKKPDELEKPHIWIDVVTAGEQVMIRIRDNGIGIESDYVEKIFDLHFRGTALSRGNGLGLYLVKKAIKLLRGRVEVVSEYGVGSNFILYFTLPARRDS